MVNKNDIISKIKYALNNFPISISISQETFKLIMLDLDKSYYIPETNINLLKQLIVGYLTLPDNTTITLCLNESLGLGEVLAEFIIQKTIYIKI